MLPGANVVNLVICMGDQLRGAAGAAVGVFGFLVGPFLAVIALSTAFDRLPDVAALEAASQGVAFAAIGLLLVICLRGVQRATRFPARSRRHRRHGDLRRAPALAADPGGAGDRAAQRRTRLAPGLSACATTRFIALVLVFVPLSLLSIGGGSAIIAAIQHEAVVVRGWIDSREFINLFAIARAAPGPGTMLGTLIGWKVAGWAGAVVATLALYLPSSLLCYGVLKATNSHRDKKWHRAAREGLAPVGTGLVIAGVIAIFRLIRRRGARRGNRRRLRRGPVAGAEVPNARCAWAGSGRAVRGSAPSVLTRT